MLEGEDYLYHSVLSPYINIGLLDPLDVCKRVVKAYETVTRRSMRSKVSCARSSAGANMCVASTG
jgi:deoxyribodipyrimidine photolyase-like uncharacterized protein